MNTKDIIVGLDVGTTKIAAIVGQRGDNNKIDIIGFGRADSIGVRRGIVANIEDTVQSIIKAIKEAEDSSQSNIGIVNIGIAGQHIKSIQQKGALIRDNNEDEISQIDIDRLTKSMFKLAMNPGEEIIEVLPQEYTIDNEPGIKQPKGMLGHKLEADFHIITGQTMAARNIIKCVKKANLDVNDLTIEPLASAEAVLSEEEKEAGVALIDIGGGTTDIAIFQDGIIRHTAVIPLGGEIITEDIKEGCSILKKHAEDLKIKFGSALACENKDEDIVTIPGLRGRPPKEITLKNLASIIQARVEEIIKYIYFEIKNSGYEKKLIAGIVLTGGGALLKHIAQLTEYLTGLDTRIGYPNEHLAHGVSEQMNSPMYATGVGLVILGIKKLEESNIKNQFDNKKLYEKEDKRGRESKNQGLGFLDRIRNYFEEDPT